MKRLDPEELRLLTRSSSKLRPVSSDEVEELIEEFAESFTGGVSFAGSADEVRNLLADVMTQDEIAQYMRDQPSEGQPVWEKLVPLRDNVLQALIMKEHPQTIAVILSRIDSNVGARLLRTLDPDFRHSLLRRMLGLKGVSDRAMNAIENGLRDDLLATMVSAPNPETRKTIAGILNKLDGSQANEILKSIAATRPEDANELKSMLFSFADLANLKPRARSLILEKVRQSRWSSPSMAPTRICRRPFSPPLPPACGAWSRPRSRAPAGALSRHRGGSSRHCCRGPQPDGARRDHARGSQLRRWPI